MMNRTIKAAVGMIAIAAMSVGTLAACGGSNSGSDNGKGKVYYLNFKPESNDAWQKLAKEYTKETGVEVKVQTAASGTYEQTLKSEIAKSEAPTLFQVNGPVGYQNWKSYTDDMKDTEPYKQLIDKNVALKDGDKVKAYVFFKGRSILFKEQGEVLLLRFANDLEEYGKVEMMPKLEGKRMTMMLAPKPKK